jgi:hypothetical protein
MTYEETWVPRIGAEATALKRRSALIGLSCYLPVIAELVVSAAAPGDSHELVTLIALLAAGSLFALYLRSRVQLKEAVSRHLGVSLTRDQMPPLVRPTAFDKWSEDRRS